MTCTWIGDFLNSSLETDLEENQKNPNTTQICFETFNSFEDKIWIWISDFLNSNLETNWEKKSK